MRKGVNNGLGAPLYRGCHQRGGAGVEGAVDDAPDAASAKDPRPDRFLALEAAVGSDERKLLVHAAGPEEARKARIRPGMPSRESLDRGVPKQTKTNGGQA